MNKRIDWIDIARGIGIILVVYGHVLRGIANAGILARSNPVWKSDYVIYTFHMPLFFVLAGLNVGHSLTKGKLPFFRNKLWTIAYPYLLWSLIQGLIQLTMPSYVNSQRAISSLLTILWRPEAQFWFLYILFLCHIAALIVWPHKWLIALLAVFGYCAGLYLSPGFFSGLTFNFAFYAIGILLSKLILDWHPNLGRSLITTAICALLFGVAAYFGGIGSRGTTTSLFSLPASLFGIALTAALSQSISLSGGKLAALLRVLGMMSMTIYILHILAASGTRIILQHLGLRNWIEQLVLGTIAGIAIPAMFHMIFSRFKLLIPLGLAPMRFQKLRIEQKVA